jgi:hypothetical protein
MNDFVDGFKMDLVELMDKWYEDLELLVDGAMFNMSFVEDDPDGNYLKLQEVMIEVLQERLIGVFEEEALN